MSKRTLQVAATVLILVALALIVSGLSYAQPEIWGLGLIAVGMAMLMSLATRWARDESGMNSS